MSADPTDSRPESDTDSGDESNAEISNDIPTAYTQLSSRRVDLIGDYAGNELFLIEGDSLLLQCFSEPQLDYENGFQMLHACYLVENFLRHLRDRKCNFHVAFFEDHEALSIPPWYPGRNASKYKLTRAAIIRHMTVNLMTAFPEIEVNVYPSMHDKAFRSYLESSGMYFIMAHDAAVPLHGVDKSSLNKQDLKHYQTVLRRMIIQFIKNGYNVALINGLEWRDTKVMTMVLEGSRKFRSVELNQEVAESTKGSVSVPELEQLDDSLADLSERERVAIIATARMLQRDGSEDCTNILYHTALLSTLPISSRRLDRAEPTDSKNLENFITAATEILESDAWSSFHKKNSTTCDVADLVDGRLLNAVIISGVPETSDMPKLLREKYDLLCRNVEKLSSQKVQATSRESSASSHAASSSATEEEVLSSTSVMPFQNPVFDKHLESIHLAIDEDADDHETPSSARIFREVTHWHNAKKPIIVKGPPTTADKKQEFWAARRNQWFMAEMRTYAASLTNAVGKSLEPETIVIGGKQITATPSVDKSSHGGKKPTKNENVKDEKKEKKKGGGKPGKGAGKAAIMESIAATKAKKDEITDQKAVQAWHTIVKNLSAERELPVRYVKAKEYQTNLADDRRSLFGAEVGLYMLSTLLEYWIQVARTKDRDNGLGLAALIWHLVKTIPKQGSLTKTIVTKLELTKTTLGLPVVLPEAPSMDRALPFKFALPIATGDSLAIKLSSKDFQLLHCGPYLDRSIDSAPDSRVEFEPDGWQRKVLDGIDANKSLFVVAPTSAGKTFISFYAMRKILEADDDSVLVYVAPTKALVNQIAAEIQARYSKRFKYAGKSVWAIHTRDYRINNPTGCQVLVTVPHVLQIMLLAPSHANSWSSKVKRIIFDEVHSIGNADDGVVWEQLLLLAPCPIIALSATVGNPEEFSGWLSSTQKSMGVELESIQHHSRYSDLRKYFYSPPEKFSFSGLEDGRVLGGFGRLGLDGAPGFSFMHPVASLINRSRGIPDDFSLEARDCLTLWQVLSKNATDKYPVSKDLDPAKALPSVVKKIDVLNWEKKLKNILATWMADASSPFDKVLADLNGTFWDEHREKSQVTKAATAEQGTAVDQDDILATTLPLLCRLHEQEALPAIFFNFERGLCERICQTVVNQLKDAETAYKESSPKWKAHIKAWEDWKKVQEKKSSKKPVKAAKTSREDGEDRTSKSEQARDAASADYSAFEGFDPEAPVDGFHFADHKKLQTSELADYVQQLGRRNIQQWLIDAISRGVGVHHAGMNRKYRQVVEILFRKGFLRVIIATGTLALGINMPTRTVVFSGDSVFLTALNFRQCAGRAGRRGFDLLGNVVFQGVPRAKVCRLLSSRLPDLNGHFPITTTLVLRLFTLLHESKQSKYAVKAINTLLSQPRLFMGGPSFREQTLHHLRFSIEYLRRQQLLDSSGATLNFAGLVSHLYFTENSSFAFHALLKEGFFHKLCADIDNKEQMTIETLMLVMSHLFGRVYCKQADQEYLENVVKPSSSLVFLPPLPEEASTVLGEHSKQILSIFTAYVQTFVEQHVHEADDHLPLSGMKAGGTNGAEVPSGIKGKVLPPTKIRSQFYALSGQSDKFASVADLCRTTRSGVFLEESVVPHVGLYPQDLESPLNAYLLDFFKHGDINTLERANKIRKADVWFLLNDFSLVLATIITSLMNFMKLKPANDLDMLEIMGNLDAVEEAEDDTMAASETESKVDSVITDPMLQPEKPVMSKMKAKKLDSWEDAATAEDAAENKSAAKKAAAEKEEIRAALSDAAWDGPGGEKGLVKVLKAFQKLQVEFNVKFKAMWA